LQVGRRKASGAGTWPPRYAVCVDLKTFGSSFTNPKALAEIIAQGDHAVSL